MRPWCNGEHAAPSKLKMAVQIRPVAQTAAITQWAECLICNQDAKGSNPFSGSMITNYFFSHSAGIAQLAERLASNQNVIGSIPITRPLFSYQSSPFSEECCFAQLAQRERLLGR
jgi:hypothetical protein